MRKPWAGKRTRCVCECVCVGGGGGRKQIKAKGELYKGKGSSSFASKKKKFLSINRKCRTFKMSSSALEYQSNTKVSATLS